jgi:hypothetical protein
LTRTARWKGPNSTKSVILPDSLGAEISMG